MGRLTDNFLVCPVDGGDDPFFRNQNDPLPIVAEQRVSDSLIRKAERPGAIVDDPHLMRPFPIAEVRRRLLKNIIGFVIAAGLTGSGALDLLIDPGSNRWHLFVGGYRDGSVEVVACLAKGGALGKGGGGGG